MNSSIKLFVISVLFMSCVITYASSNNNIKKDSLFHRQTLSFDFLALEKDKPFTDFFEDTYPNDKRDVKFVFSIPYINAFNFKPYGFDEKNKIGFWGVSSGLEYFYKKDKYISLKLVGAINFSLFSLIKAAAKEDELNFLSTTYVEFTDNFKRGKLNIGLGVNYAVNNWRFIDQTDQENEIKISRKNRSLGVTLNGYYQLGKTFFIGLVYRPTFYRIYPVTDFKYEHLLSLDFIFKMPYRKK